MITIKPASLIQLHELHKLFESYRAFYEMAPNEEKSLAFLKSRIAQQDSIIWMAFYQNQAAGFVQIYPAYTSVGMAKIWILNDLFVDKSYRRKGIAQKLMSFIEEQARTQSIFSIKLATQVDNINAKHLYQALGYKKLDAFDHFSKRIV